MSKVNKDNQTKSSQHTSGWRKFVGTVQFGLFRKPVSPAAVKKSLASADEEIASAEEVLQEARKIRQEGENMLGSNA